MPRGKYVNHKGRGRSFTSAEELAREEKAMKEKQNRRKEKDDEESSSDEGTVGDGDTATKKSEHSSSSEEESSDDENRKTKGVEGLLAGEIENPNRRVVKQKKLSKLDDTSSTPNNVPASTSAAPELSRREREAIEKQKAKERYQKLHAEGKTEEARADLARLAIIRKQREEAAQKRLMDQQEKDSQKQTKTNEKLGKK